MPPTEHNAIEVLTCHVGYHNVRIHEWHQIPASMTRGSGMPHMYTHILVHLFLTQTQWCRIVLETRAVWCVWVRVPKTAMLRDCLGALQASHQQERHKEMFCGT